MTLRGLAAISSWLMLLLLVWLLLLLSSDSLLVELEELECSSSSSLDSAKLSSSSSVSSSSTSSSSSILAGVEGRPTNEMGESTHVCSWFFIFTDVNGGVVVSVSSSSSSSLLATGERMEYGLLTTFCCIASGLSFLGDAVVIISVVDNEVAAGCFVVVVASTSVATWAVLFLVNVLLAFVCTSCRPLVPFIPSSFRGILLGAAAAAAIFTFFSFFGCSITLLLLIESSSWLRCINEDDIMPFCACDVVVGFGLADAEREASIPPVIWPRALPLLLRAAGRDLDGNSAIVALWFMVLTVFVIAVKQSDSWFDVGAALFAA